VELTRRRQRRRKELLLEAFDALHYLLEPSGLITDILNRFGKWVYLTLFAIVFAETGLVLTPFLPGDSLLFAAGTFAGTGRIDVWVTVAAITAAAIMGDAVNYAIGRFFGPRLAARFPRLIPARHMEASQAFFEQYGGRAVLLARFVPVIRTFIPFVAGMCRMPIRRFWQFNIAGALAWVIVFLGAGYFFGQIPWVERNLTLAMILVVVASVVPILVKGWRQWRRRARPNGEQHE